MSHSGPVMVSDVVSLQKTFAQVSALPYNQKFNDCGANAAAAVIDYEIARDAGLSGSLGGFLPSRLFLYYNARFLDGGVAADNGVFMRDMLTTAQDQGFTSEVTTPAVSAGATWPYITATKHYLKNPGAAAYMAGRSYRITGFTPVPDNVAAMKGLIDAGRPFIVWVNVASNFPSPLEPDEPRPKEPPTIPTPEGQGGGHFVVAVGYNEAKKALLVLNSWGRHWGQDGYAYLPFSEFRNHHHANAQYAISGVMASTTPPAAIGGLGDLVARAGRDEAKGQIHIDTRTATTSGTATSFDFFSDTSAGSDVTPLLFSYDAAAGTYTLTGIGRSISHLAGGSQGIPFDLVAGSAEVTTHTVFGFYDGRLEVTRDEVGGDKSFALGKANAGIVPYSTGPAGTTTWLTTADAVRRGLKIGATFSIHAGADQVKLDATSSNRVYSAMLVE